jgi:hypothetical protein
VHDHRHRIPADERFDATLDGAITRVLHLVARRNRIDVSRVRLERQVRAGAAGEIDQLFEQEVSSFGALRLDH